MYIFGHVPPGIYERHYSRQALHWFQERFNRRYLQLVQTYSDVIAGQFFGHAHTDSFRVVYDDSGNRWLPINIILFFTSQTRDETIVVSHVVVMTTGRPISWILLAPAVSPREPGLAEGTGANNPAIRLVKFNTDSGQVRSITSASFSQLFLSLPSRI